ncbi:hypothetical protein IHE45_15G093000 [Dioscorea alata]|uniref:Uncharacterized protein n=1 Tax=Dioscorea alata TaxID=55571 RepID=A0ACB7UN64_DIOAL|nr:hypothetical protein IHE45_15G093000 [Dioscorea alata]
MNDIKLTFTNFIHHHHQLLLIYKMPPKPSHHFILTHTHTKMAKCYLVIIVLVLVLVQAWARPAPNQFFMPNKNHSNNTAATSVNEKKNFIFSGIGGYSGIGFGFPFVGAVGGVGGGVGAVGGLPVVVP